MLLPTSTVHAFFYIKRKQSPLCISTASLFCLIKNDIILLCFMGYAITNLIINNTANTYINGLTSLCLPANTLMAT